LPDIETILEKAVVAPIFDSLGSNGHRDQSLPEIVLANRRTRAFERVLQALISRGAPKVPDDLRVRLESMIDAWSTQSFDDAFQPILEFEIQCARERDLVVAEQSGDQQRVLDVLEQEYRRQVAKRFGSVELRGIQLNHRVILDLDKVFVPLHVEELGSGTKEGDGRILQMELPFRRMPISGIVKENVRILLIGSPGAGKSTLVSYLASRCARGDHGLRWPDRALPFVVTVRELKDANLSPAWLAAQAGVAPHVVSSALSQKRAVILIDGLDEAPEDLRKQLVAALSRFTGEHPITPVIVTSRPAGSPGEIEDCLAGFGAFRLVDLDGSEVDDFIDRWCLAAESSARPNSEDARREARTAAADLKSRIARSRPVQRIAVNPLLTTIVCVVHRFLGRTIPEHRVTLYEKCTDALLYEWDRAKFPKDAAVGNLDANQKRALLRGVASALHEQHAAEIPESDVVRHFAATLPKLGKPEEDALRIVREIRDRSGLLVERRPGAFAFSHLTFQEYLTALDYASRSEQLLQHLDDRWWHEVIALAVGVAGCDPVKIIRAILQKKGPEAVILAAKCLETAIDVPLDLRIRVEAAVEGILPGRDPEDFQGLLEVGLTVAPILARRLLSYDARGKEQSLDFFQMYEYEPIIPVLIELTSDKKPVHFSVRFGDGKTFRPTLGEWAAFVMSRMAPRSESARRAVASVLSRPQSRRSIEFFKASGVLPKDLRSAGAGNRSSKRAKSTA
jgi:energy-coupling factor transporter ATP-binding protein EcfA2